jgi:hypothetical protein
MSTTPMRPTPQKLHRRAARLHDESLLVQRTRTRNGRSTDQRSAIRESMADWS